ncbi:MAG: hypothetical protein HC769_16840 [Cyanobacteria bacterium CRU_2_1]|nr:hypothetical protein [Cyanobacteria bacterium RU_5_0]NJR60345.1 hypothetical protein [Cyanobacteria bacterium CRU_2_1]
MQSLIKRLLWVTLPFTVFGVSSPSFANTVPSIDQLVSQLEQVTQVPILFPDAIPQMAETYVNGHATANGYALNFDYTSTCNGSTACHFGGISAEGNESLAVPEPRPGRDAIEPVELADGSRGYFVNTCGAYCTAVVTWESEGVLYQVHIKNGRQDEVLELANSAILAGARTTTTAQEFIPSGTAVLLSREYQSPINIRDGASTTADIQHIGYSWDRIELLDRTIGDDGVYWYQIQFPESGAMGWVRGDFVAIDLNHVR